MTSSRRRGSQDTESRAKLIEAATHLLAREGTAAITARKVAQAVGLSHQIVHYYFKTMDDLLIEIVNYGMDEAVAVLEKAVGSPFPLNVVAKLDSRLLAVIMGTELTIYARDKPAMRDAVRLAIGRYRCMQLKLFAQHFTDREPTGAGSPLVATVVMTSILRMLVIEEAVGVTEGHRETLQWLADVLLAPELASLAP